MKKRLRLFAGICVLLVLLAVCVGCGKENTESEEEEWSSVTGSGNIPVKKPKMDFSTTTGSDTTTSTVGNTTTTGGNVSDGGSNKNATTTANPTTTGEEQQENDEPEIPSNRILDYDPRDYKLLALGFDDAPCDSKGVRIRQIVDTMNKYGGAGTFFVVGSRLEQFGIGGESSLKYALNNGFELSNHTYGHYSVNTDDIGRKMTVGQLYNDFNKCQELLKSKFGVTAKWLRPSGLHTNSALFEATTRLGLPVITRSISSGDTDSKNTSQDITNNLLTKAFDGGIVLMHSTNQATVDALDSICSQLYARGFRFVTISELFEYKGVSYEDIPTNKEIGGYDPVNGTFLGSMI